MRKLAYTVTAVALLLNGCASIVSGTTDDIKIDTVPTGADCTVYRSGNVVGRVHTPQTVNVKRSGSPLLAVCENGEQTGRDTIDSGFNSWVLGNMLFIAPGAIIVGLVVDGVTGAWHGYDDAEVKLN